MDLFHETLIARGTAMVNATKHGKKMSVGNVDEERNAALFADTIDRPPAVVPPIDPRFSLGVLIARGGMGEVYEAHDAEKKCDVAIKVLAPRFWSDPELRARFRREAEALSKLSHPNVVRVIAVGTDAPYFVMEKIAGRTLAEELRQRAHFPTNVVLELGAQLLDALAHIHAAGLIHRDVKPANLMISSKHHLTLLDFGIARSEDSALTNTGATVGTPEYMAPEQARDARLASKQSDLYAAGATLYAAWVGAPPFTGSSAYEIISQHHQRQPPAPSSKRPELSAEIDRMISRALAKDPHDRFESAAEMAEALAGLRLQTPKRRWWPILALAALAAAAVAGWVVVSWPKVQVGAAATPLVEVPVQEITPPVVPVETPLELPDAGMVQAAAKRSVRPVLLKTAPAPAEQPEAFVRIVTLDRGISTYAEVIIDGEPPRFSPVARWVLKPGSHAMIVRREGYAPHTLRFELAPGEQKKIELLLEKN
jgi:tRNA A-37 threonylcarbamoyl transferase component Bud32